MARLARPCMSLAFYLHLNLHIRILKVDLGVTALRCPLPCVAMLDKMSSPTSPLSLDFSLFCDSLIGILREWLSLDCHVR